jgi:hypothetical protein
MFSIGNILETTYHCTIQAYLVTLVVYSISECILFAQRSVKQIYAAAYGSVQPPHC